MQQQQQYNQYTQYQSPQSSMTPQYQQQQKQQVQRERQTYTYRHKSGSSPQSSPQRVSRPAHLLPHDEDITRLRPKSRSPSKSSGGKGGNVGGVSGGTALVVVNFPAMKSTSMRRINITLQGRLLRGRCSLTTRHRRRFIHNNINTLTYLSNIFMRFSISSSNIISCNNNINLVIKSSNSNGNTIMKAQTSLRLQEAAAARRN